MSTLPYKNYEIAITAETKYLYGDRITIKQSYEGGWSTLKGENYTLTLNVTVRELIENSLKELGAPLLKPIEINYANKIGSYAIAILQCSARQSLEYWMKILDKVQRYGIPIFVEWTGDTDVTPEEMGYYLGKVLAKMNVFLATKEPLDIIRILREEWGL